MVKQTIIPALVQHFVERKAKELKIHTPPSISANSIVRLQNYHWPGNVRELENLIERALIQSRGQNVKDSLSYDFFAIPEKASETSIVFTEKENLIIESQKFIAFVRGIYLVGLSIENRKLG